MKRAIDGAVTAGLAVVIVLGGAVISRAHATPARDGMVVTTEWVAQHLKDADLVLLHVGEKQDYDAAHLPGAQFLPREAFGIRDAESNLTLQVPPVPALVERLGALGVSDTTRVVLYFGTDWVTPTARAYVTFDYLGLGDRTSIMDGGLPAWQAEHRPVTADVVPPRAGRFTPVPGPRSSPTSPTCSPTCGRRARSSWTAERPSSSRARNPGPCRVPAESPGRATSRSRAWSQTTTS